MLQHHVTPHEVLLRHDTPGVTAFCHSRGLMLQRYITPRDVLQCYVTLREVSCYSVMSRLVRLGVTALCHVS